MDEWFVMRENAAGLLIASVPELFCGPGPGAVLPPAAGLQHCGPWTGGNLAAQGSPSHGICDVSAVATARNIKRFPRWFVHTWGLTCAIHEESRRRTAHMGTLV